MAYQNNMLCIFFMMMMILLSVSNVVVSFTSLQSNSRSNRKVGAVRLDQKLQYIVGFPEASTATALPPQTRASFLFSPVPEVTKRKQQQQKVAEPKQQATTEEASHPVAINNRHAASDWLYNLKSLPQSTILRDIQHPLKYITLWATGMSVLHCVLKAKLPAVASALCVNPAAHSLLMSSLGLLLVFRTNSAYQRYLEGRKIWEDILTVSRNLTRLITLYKTEVGPSKSKRIQHLLASFPYLLRHHVREGCLCCSQDKDVPQEYRLKLTEPSTRQEVDSRYEGDEFYKGIRIQDGALQCHVDKRDLPWSLLDDVSSKKKSQSGNNNDVLLQRVAQASNRPLWICDRLGQEVMRIPYGPNFTSRERLTILGSLDKLTNAIGQCERIHQTAVPLNYARHALRGLTIWLVTLPFCLLKDFGLLTGPVTGLVAWLLFGVYQIGHSIEDPFQSLRLSILCDAIRRDVLVNNDEEDINRQSAFDLREDDQDEDDEYLHHTLPSSGLDPIVVVPSPSPAFFPKPTSLDLVGMKP